MIVIADTSGIIAASDRNAPEARGCRDAMRQAGLVVVSPLVIAEVDHLSNSRFGARARRAVIGSILEEAARLHFQIPEVDVEALVAARELQQRYAALDLDLADAVNVVLAAEYQTNVVLTLDRRDFRAVCPLNSDKAFRLLPDDA